ncbi:MAG: threonine ammonia-lyase [Bdellovibrionales bacterium]|nr:threonine ammonia-lyase [Bdellovibrionales bacterium]
MKVTLEDIRKARETLRNISQNTETDYSVSASKMLGCEVFLKFENTQRTGSFKIRGAYNKIINLTPEEKKRGVVASSAGNHAQGVALSAALAGVKATIVMPENAPLTKVNATRGYGAEVILHGEIYDDAYEHARHLEKEKGYVFVHPYEDPYIIAGQGTIGLELHDKLPDLDSVVVPIGGGGLISGISTALKALNPKIRIIGVQSEQAPGMSQLFHHQTPEDRKRISTIADGIAIKKPSKIVYESFIAKNVDEVVTVSDDELAEAIVFLLERAKTMTEGSGAAAMAAVMNRQLNLGKKTCVILSGGNVDLNVIAKIIEKGQIKRGRLAELSVVVDDLPGNLNRLTKAIAEQKANILEVHHDRISQGLFLRETRIDFVLETSSPEHIQKIKQALIAAGGKIL